MSGPDGLLPIVGWMLVHSVWQATLAWAIARIGCRVTTSPARRCAICTAALALFVMAQVATAAALAWLPSDHAILVSDEAARAALARVNGRGVIQTIELPAAFTLADWLRFASRLLPVAVAVWSLIVVVATLRLVCGLVLLRREARDAVDVATRFEPLLHDAIAQRGPVRIIESRYVSGPATAGWRAPMILVPPRQLLDLPDDQWRALLIHEVAHISRGDFLLNLLRACVRALYAFNPAVRSLYASAEQSAEEATDADAAQMFGDRQGYARALVALAKQERTVAASMRAAGGSLRARVTRLLAPASTRDRLGPAAVWGTISAGAVALGCFGYFNTSLAAQQRDATWLASHGLHEAIISTLTVDAPQPRFAAALADALVAVQGQVEGERVAAVDRLAEALLAGVPSDAISRHAVGVAKPRSAALGTLGRYADRQQLARRMAADAIAGIPGLERVRLARAALILAALDAPLDVGSAAQSLVRRREFAERLDLSPAALYRLQLACAIHNQRIITAQALAPSPTTLRFVDTADAR